MKKFIVFDFDGTIANTIPITISIIKKYSYSDFNRKLDDSVIEELRDRPIPEIFKALNISIVKLPFIAEKIRKELNKEIELLKPIKGIKEVLIKLKEQGKGLGIVSSNSNESIKKFLTQNGLELFDFVYTNSMVFGKSSSLNRAIKEFDIDKEDLVYLGDEIRDIEAARKVGIKIISVTWGVNSKDKLASYSPDFLVAKPSEILSILESAKI